MVTRMKILIIEDDLEAAAYLAKAFREAGIVSDHASDGESGLFMASENSYDVLVIDRMLPRRRRGVLVDRCCEKRNGRHQESLARC